MEDIVKNEFLFYSKLAKPLILNLPKSKDRILAAAWIKKFREENVGDEKLRTTYLKLLLFCLQRRRLTGIFSDDPLEYDVLEELPAECNLNDLAKNLLDQEKMDRTEKVRLEMMGDMAVFPAYTTDCSPDLTEYVAAQDIPNFGVHAYYAISRQPINKWQRCEKAILPKGTKSAIDTSIIAAAGAQESSCVCAPKSAASAPEVEGAPADGDEADCRKKKDKGPERKKRRTKKLGTQPPTHPIGEVRHHVEERATPTWGTNLLDVREPTDVGKIDEPTDAEKDLEEEVSKLMEEAEEEEDEDDDEKDRDDIKAKADDMMHIIDEWKQGKLDKTKGKKVPSRLAKLGDRSGIKVPKSTKAGPKIPVKGMKKGKGKGKGKYGPKPANLPEEFADWDEKDLEEAGLTWDDLMPIDEDVDAELQRIEDEAMGGDDEEDMLDLPDPYEGLTDYDALIREAEAELAADKSIYDAGVEEDEPVVELFDDELEELEDELNLSRAADEVQKASPALTSGIPVTTPKRSPTPRRSRSPETAFAEEDDVLLQHRTSPLRAPKQQPIIREDKAKSRSLREPTQMTNKDINISNVFEKAKTAADQSFLQHEEEDEFERLERQFALEDQAAPSTSARQPMRIPDQSPVAAQRAWERAQEQQQLLRTPPDPAYSQFQQDFEGAEGFLEDDAPCAPCSPPQMTEEEEFEMLERMYSPSRRTPPQAYSPTTGAPLQIPAFDYGPSDVGSPDRFDYLTRPPPVTPEFIKEHQRKLGIRAPSPSPPPPAPQPPLVSQEEQQRQRAEAMTRAWEQEVRLRLGSPQANEIIVEAEENLQGKLGRRLRIGQDKMLEESPPAGVKTPPRKIELPPRPLFSPTTGAPLEVPAFNIRPEDLDSSWEEGGEEIPQLTRVDPLDYLYVPTQEELTQRYQRETTDIFERCGDACVTESDRAPVRPQYFPPGLDIAAPDSPPFPTAALQEHEIPDEFFDRQRRGMTKQSNICVGAKRRDRTLRQQDWPVSQVSPIQDEPYLEHLEKILSPLRPKGPVPQAQGLSPWRHEDIYQTPSQGDSTLEGADWPLWSPPRTPPGQLPQERPLGFMSPFYPGVTTPRTPPLQRPEERPEGFVSPFVPGFSSPLTPPWQYPQRRPERYATPPPPTPPTPLEEYWDPEAHLGMGLVDVDQMEDILPEESPQPCTPCDDRELPAPTRFRRPQTDQGLDETPLRPHPMQMTARQLFSEEEQPCGPCGVETPTMTPTRPPSPVRPAIPQRQIPTRIPGKGQIPTRLPSKGQVPSKIPPSRIPSKGQIPAKIPSMRQMPSRMPRPGLQRPAPRADRTTMQRPAPVAQGPMTPTGQRILPDGSVQVPQRRPPRVGTPTVLGERRSRRLFQGDDEGQTTCVPCIQPQTPQQRPPTPQAQPPFMTPEAGPSGWLPGYNSDFESPPPPSPPRTPRFAPAKKIKKKGRYPKVVTPQPPATPPQPPPVRSPWSTPEGVPGPSRRPTGLTPPVYDSDFSPPPTPVRTPKFAPAKRIKKRGRPAQLPRTPEDEREPPSPFTVPAQPPCRRAGHTPVQRFPTQMTGRRIFKEPGDWPREPAEEPPIQYSPFEPFVPDQDDYVSPPPPPFVPELLKTDMYYPPQVQDVMSPEQYPTIEEIMAAKRLNDPQRLKQSKNIGIGGGPGPYLYRDSYQPLIQKTAATPADKRIIQDIPEYEDDFAWEYDLTRREDVDWLKHIKKPPSQQGKERRLRSFEYPYTRRSPRPARGPDEPDEAPCIPCAGEENVGEQVPAEIVIEDEEPFPLDYGDAFQEVLTSNLQLSPSQYPAARPPEPTGARIPVPMQQRLGGQTFIERSEAFLAAAVAGTLTEHIAQRGIQDIAQQGDLFFDTEAQLLDELPPEDMGFDNYYPEVIEAADRLQTSVQDYGLSPPARSPRTPLPRQVASPPCKIAAPPTVTAAPLRKKTAPPREEAAPQRKGTALFRRVPLSGRAAPTPSAGGPCGPGPCGAGPAVEKKPSKGKVSLRETKSSQLRKKQQAEKEKEKLSPTSRLMKQRKEKAAKAAEEKKKKAAAKKKADEEARREKARRRAEEGIPGPELAQELMEHQVKYPRRQMGFVDKGGKFRRVPRRSEEAVTAMEHIQEEEGSPCAPCDGEDEYQAVLKQLGLTEQEAAAAFDMNIFDEMEEEEAIQEGGSPDAVQQLEAQLREMDAYEREQAEFWREMGADLTDAELRELGVTRESLMQPAPCGPCGPEVPGPSTRPPERQQLTQQQEQMLAQLREIEARVEQIDEEPQRSPILTEFDLLEQAVIQREQEEREYFERMMGRGPEAQSPVRSPQRGPVTAYESPQRRPMSEEDEQREFEELERQMAMDRLDQEQVCPGARSSQLSEAAQQQESITRRRLFEQQLQMQGPPTRGRPFPASGITYSPPRPQGPFGPPPYPQIGGRLPVQSPRRQETPPEQPSSCQPCESPTRPPARSPFPPRTPSPPPGFLEEISPPYIEDEEARLPDAPRRPPPPPRWSPTPSPPRAPSPPSFVPTPPSPLLFPPEVREQVASMSRPEFDPVRRRDVLQRDARRAFKAPGVGLYNVQEEEPLIPELAGDESYMGWPVIPGERAPKRRKRYYKDKKAKRLFDKSEISKSCRRLAKKFDLPKLPPAAVSPEQPDYILDDSLPSDLPVPLRPQWPQSSPIRRLPLEPVPLPPWEEGALRPVSPIYPQEMVQPIGDLYQTMVPVHPDLAGLIDYEPPLPLQEGIEDLGGMPMEQEMFYSPERYPEIDERELDREAAWGYQPPEILKNIWLASPQELGAFTPPSVGRGPCGTYTPRGTPPLGILDSPCLGERMMDENVAGPELQEFLVPTPPLERITSLQEMKYRTYHAKGREGIKPQPQYFGGYGETPQRPVPRWYGRGGAVNVIREVEEPFSPPTPGTPPPQLPAPCSTWSPRLDEFERLERETQEKESRRSRKSRRHQKRRDLEDARRQMELEELTEQAERSEMERRRAPPRAPSPRRTPPAPQPEPAVEYGPVWQDEGAPCSPCEPSQIDRAALEQFMLEEMGFDPGALPEMTPPASPEFLDQAMYDIFEGVESPPPLSPEAEGPCMPCTPPAPPSPPPRPGSPVPPAQSELQKYIAQMEREDRARQEIEARRQQIYQANIEDIRQTFGPSPGPPSPGPDQDFYASIYGHQVPAPFRQGARSRTAVRDQIGKREITLQIPRHTPAPGLPPITEQRVRMPTEPERSRRGLGTRPRSATGDRSAPAAAPAFQVDQRTSAQRIAEARKHYQQMGRQKKLGRSRSGTCPGAQAQPQPQVQLNLQPVEEFLRQPDQQGPPPETCPGRPEITPEEGQRRARERLRARKLQEQSGPPTRAPRQEPPGPQQFTGLVPTQVQMRIPRPPPQQQVQTVDEFIRGGPRPGAGPSRSRLQAQPSTSGTQIRRQPSTSRQQPGGGCGGSGRPCGSSRQEPSGSSSRISQRSAQQRSQQQPEQQPQEGPRRVVRTTSSVKKIVTKQKK